jgi:hypothetical protein
MVLSDVFALGFLHPIEALAISVDDLEAVPHFGHPKGQVGHVPGKLVPVKGDKPCQLLGQGFRDVGGICHAQTPELMTNGRSIPPP